ncbi:phage protein, putative [Enterococcus malodoratus]|uniref:DUF1642 domain-containing protein n=1 Tax=Enterococcus malodoratus TaxID=71451 RepID=UPI000D9C4931|nr:DUF1642 domain-containing protein [Enterococcus malodoratus]SPW86804.1 phage protein, putative [Enterococcus malodoratus]
MNKEKFINKLNEELDELKGKELLYFNMRDSVQEARCTNRIFGIQYALNCARLLDEPQKVKVKQYVADWYEEHKHNLSNSLWEFTVELNEKTNVTGAISEFESWFIEHPCAYEFITSMKNGYEVEEEPKWVVKVNNMYFLNWGEDGTCPTFVIDDAPRTKEQAEKYESEQGAESVAEIFGGTVEKV